MYDSNYCPTDRNNWRSCDRFNLDFTVTLQFTTAFTYYLIFCELTADSVTDCTESWLAHYSLVCFILHWTERFPEHNIYYYRHVSSRDDLCTFTIYLGVRSQLRTLQNDPYVTKGARRAGDVIHFPTRALLPAEYWRIYISLYLYCRMRRNLLDGQSEEEVAGVDHQRNQDL